nr:facilitated trehalose transporter Tret1-like [Onthophagus taurus]
MKISFADNLKRKNGNQFYQYLCTATATLTLLTSAMHYGWPSPSLPKLLANEHHFQISDEQGSWIAVITLIGCPFGAILACTLVNILGRKKVILLTGPNLILAWILVAYGKRVEIMVFARFIAGISDGIIYTVIPMYIGEVADPNIRGLLGSSCSVTMMFGILLVNILGVYFDITTLAMISVSIPLVFLITFPWMPESPYYLVMKGKMEDAKANLRKLKGIEDVDADINRLTNAVKEKNKKEKARIWDLFLVRSNRKGILIIMCLRAVQQLSGISALTFYANTIFKELEDTLSSNITTAIFFSIQCLISMLSAFLLDKAGRKPLLITSAIGCALCLLLQATYYYLNTKLDISHLSLIPIISLICYIIAYCIGLGTIPVLMLSELFPTTIKAFALCFAELYFSLIATAVSKFFQITKDTFGIYVPFYVFGVCTIIGLIWVTFSIPETKGKTLEEIQELLQNSNKEKEDTIEA